MSFVRIVSLLLLLVGAAPVLGQSEFGTAFTYQGQLEVGGQPASGSFDFRFSLLVASEGAMLTAPIAVEDLQVDRGLVTARLDFLLPPNGGRRWLRIEVRPSASTGAYTTLFPSVELTGQLYAQFSERAALALEVRADGVGSEQIRNASIGVTEIDPAQVQRRVSGSCTAGSSIRAISEAGTVTCEADDGALAWSPGGNAGTNTDFHYLGTSDNRALNLRVNNRRVAVFTPTTGAANIVFGDSTWAEDAVGVTISGGGNQAIGAPNQVREHYGTIGGGHGNLIDTGDSSRDDGAYATIAGGLDNQAVGATATVGGGQGNTAGPAAVVAGGAYNSALADYSAVLGGYGNSAEGSGSVAAGRLARALHPGSFVWNDRGTDLFNTDGPQQFLVRASGGMALNGRPLSDQIELNVIADDNGANYANLLLRQRDFDAGIMMSAGEASSTAANNAAYYIDQTNGSAQLRIFQIAANRDLTIFSANAFKPGGGAWATSSDRRLKQHIRPLDNALDRLLALRGTEFEYRDPNAAMGLPGRQVGFVAQEVRQVFPDWVATGPTGYLTVAPKGFEALTVEALRDLRAEAQVRIEALEQRQAELEADNAALHARLERLERKLGGRAR